MKTLRQAANESARVEWESLTEDQKLVLLTYIEEEFGVIGREAALKAMEVLK